MASLWTNVKRLRVQLRDGGSEAVLYGNGRHQVAVQVTFEPIDTDGNPVTVTEKELRAATKLVDFVTTLPIATEKTAQDWFYSNSANDYFVPLQPPTQTAAAVESASATASLTFYVMCGDDCRRRIRSIAASVTPAGSTVATNSALKGRFDSKVTLKAFDPPVYKAPAGEMPQRIGWKSVDPPLSGVAWQQRNYYLSIKSSIQGIKRKIHKANLEGFKTDQDPKMLNRSFYFLQLVMGYVWQVNGPEARNVWPDDETAQLYPRRVALEFTRITGVNSSGIPPSIYLSPLVATILDQFGNSGTLYVMPDMINTFFPYDMRPFDGLPVDEWETLTA